MADEVKPAEKPAITSEHMVAALKYVLAETQKVGKRFDDLEVKMRNIPTTTLAPTSKGEDRDVDAMTNGELVEHITKQVSSSILTPIQKQLTDLSTRMEKDTLSTQINTAAATYPDFWEYREEIQNRVKDNPNMSMDDAYHLALKDNKGKTEELARKRTEDAAAAKAAEDAKKPAFAGLLPTSNLSSASTKMQPKDAAQAAWDEVMADVPADMIH